VIRSQDTTINVVEYLNERSVNYMSFNPRQFRELIYDTLEIIIPEYNSPEAVELLMLTAAQESFLGRFIKQLYCGVAKGVFQMEMATYNDLFDSYIRYKPDLQNKLFHYFPVNEETADLMMCGNLPYQIVIARLNYYRKRGNIPHVEDINGLAEYYKKHWNTHLGAATVKEALRNYWKYAR